MRSIVLFRYHVDTGIAAGSVAATAVLLHCAAWRTGPLLATAALAFSVVAPLVAVGRSLFDRWRDGRGVVVRDDSPGKPRHDSLKD